METSSSSVSVNFNAYRDESLHVLRNSNLSVTFRFLRSGDQAEVKALCTDWFPIEYPDKWYNDITQQKKYFALAACDAATEKIIALIVANLLPLANCNIEDHSILHRKFPLTTSVCYILTLGVAKEHRRQGLASILLDHLVNTLHKYNTCKAIYLHVLFSNKQAIDFYKSKLFQYRTHLPYYYLIKNEYFDAYCFAHYINGGYPPFTLSDLLSSVRLCLIRINPCRLIDTIRYFLKNKFMFTPPYQLTLSRKQISRII